MNFGIASFLSGVAGFLALAFFRNGFVGILFFGAALWLSRAAVGHDQDGLPRRIGRTLGLAGMAVSVCMVLVFLVTAFVGFGVLRILLHEMAGHA